MRISAPADLLVSFKSLYGNDTPSLGILYGMILIITCSDCIR